VAPGIEEVFFFLQISHSCLCVTGSEIGLSHLWSSE